MAVVVDASLAVKWVVPEADSEDALTLLDSWQAGGQRLLAPPLFKAEVTNVLHRKVRQGFLGREDALEADDTLLSLVGVLEPPGLYTRALTLANELELRWTYDALYLALAEAQGCEMWTADRRFVRSVQARYGQVRWIGEVD